MTQWMSPGHTAVITGGASGIGLAAATRFAAEGMNVVLADLDADRLASAAATIHAADGASILTAATDVTDIDQLEKTRDLALRAFGRVDCLMNNAGASLRQGRPWEDLDAFKRQIDINFWGVVNGCHTFLPSMLTNETPAAVINTGSKQGITKPPGNFAYNISKTGVIAYTESIAHALRDIDSCPLRAHLLIPGFTYTGMISRFLPEKPDSAWTPEDVIEFMLDGVANDDFYILCPDHETPRELDEKRIRWNMNDIIENRPALSRWHPDFKDDYESFVG